MFNSKRPKSCGNRVLLFFNFLRSPRATRWIGFEGYEYTGRKLNGWLIDKVWWIVVVEALLRLNSAGFNNLSQYTTVTNQC